jgi:hypothetical protein
MVTVSLLSKVVKADRTHEMGTACLFSTVITLAVARAVWGSGEHQY